MECLITSGLTLPDCETRKGGVYELYFVNHSELEDFTEVGGEVTEVTLALGAEAYHIALAAEQEIAVANDELAGEKANGTMFFNPSVTFPVWNLSAATRNALSQLAKSRLVIFVKDWNQTWRVFGIENGMTADRGEWFTTGAARADSPGTTVTFSGMGEDDMHLHVAQAVIDLFEAE